MNDSALISPHVREYVIKYKIEDVLNEAVNNILLNLPDDPFSSLSNIVLNNSSELFKLSKLELNKKLTNEFKQVHILEIYLIYKGYTRHTISYPITFNSKTFELINHSDISDVFEKHYKNQFNNKIIDSQFDKLLNEIYKGFNNEDNHKHISMALSNSISFAVNESQAIIQEISLKNYTQSIYKINKDYLTNIGFAIFKCGKSMNSKVKFERFVLILNNSSKLKIDELNTMYSKIYSSIRKVLTAGKLGENGIRLNSEGSYYSPNDTVNDTIKLIEEIIKDLAEPGKFSIGIDCCANNYYTEATKKYEMDGFKQPSDVDQLIDFYLKFITDHPLINYLEDPIADTDIAGWKKLYSKFEGKHVTISTKNMIKDFSSLKELNHQNDDNTNEGVHTDTKEEKVDHLHFSLRPSEFTNVDEFSKCCKFLNNKGLTIWDHSIDNDRTTIIDYALGIRANYIILHGFNNRNEKINKLNRYAKLIEEFY